MVVKGRSQARLSEAFFRNVGAREWRPLRHMTLGRLPAPGDGGLVSGKPGGTLRIEQLKIAFTSSGASDCGRRDRPIRKNIIGHSRCYLRDALTGRGAFLHSFLASPLFIKH